MTPAQLVDVVDASQVSEARRAASEAAAAIGLDATDQGRVALAVTEAARNLVKHAHHGLMLICGRCDGAALTVLALDRGPGLANPAAAMRDGYSTAGTPGNGLGAMQRLADRFDLFTSPQGTGVLLEFRRARAPAADDAGAAAGGAVAIEAGPRFAALSLPLRGEPVCGDGWSARRLGARTALMVADGLGHGLQASVAAQAAVAAFERADEDFADLPALMQRMHGLLRATRGAAIGIACIERGQLSFAGVGNVVCRLLGAGFDKQLVSHNGTVGHAMRTPRLYQIPLPAQPVLLMHSDGLSGRWTPDTYPGLLAKPAALLAGVLFRDLRRPHDDATLLALHAG